MGDIGRILIADDDVMFRDAMSELLTSEGFTCDVSADGMTAAAMLNTGDFDLLITDIRMPGNTEMQLVRHVPEIAEWLPVIVVTGFPSLQTAVDSAELPVISYLVKPIEYEELLSVVRRAIDHAAVCKCLFKLQHRLEDWSKELASTANLLRRPNLNSGITPQGFCTASLRQIVSCTQEVNTLHARVAKSHGQRDGALVPALSEAIRMINAGTPAAG